ncbi:Imm1 family immunity protein [Kineosporia sp. R_H_3]|uniref:Imm1 family immunity protein n=1 Tax=Kineosporia sp. R_H_3 TaxID=1961848 RepID=UPI001E33C0FF|nr:Imm1 family immunity protein [Kineosporia sp. R_H_3]
MSIHYWDPRRGISNVDAVTTAEAVAAIRSLVGSGRSEVYLGQPSGEWLGVAIADGGIFVGHNETEEGPSFQAVGPQDTGDLVELTIGGEPTTIADRYITSVGAAIGAAAHFVDHGGRWPAIEWDDL